MPSGEAACLRRAISPNCGASLHIPASSHIKKKNHGWIRDTNMGSSNQAERTMFVFYGPKLPVSTLIPGQTDHVTIALETKHE